MVDKKTKLRWRRLWRRQKRSVDEISSSTNQSFEKQFIRRLVKLPKVQRFLLGWLGLLFFLSVGVFLQGQAVGDKYLKTVAIPGGTFSEGIVGEFTNASPLYAANNVDSSVSELVFSGLLKHDQNNKLIGDLAESWSVDATEKVYTVKLKENLTWHDGKPISAKDVVFTYQMIQNPSSKSYLYSSWQGIKVEQKDERTVVFSLPSVLSSFPHSLTNGIVPSHILEKTEASQLRLSSFNNENPVGSGPFKFKKVEVKSEVQDKKSGQVGLERFDNYSLGTPKIASVVIRTYPDEQTLINAYKNKVVSSMVGLTSVPDEFKVDAASQEYAIPLSGQVMVFFKTNQEILQDLSVRKALVLATNKKNLFESLPYSLVPIDGPLLEDQVGYDPTIKQSYSKPDEARALLDQAGWLAGQPGDIRAKNGKELKFKLYSQSNSEYSSIASSLQKQWREIGVNMEVELQSDEDLQGTLAQHSYDALLYGVSVGADSDVFAFWHSTQADPRSSTRLNFSEYKSVAADKSLEAGRTRSDAQVRQVKYKPFLEAWRNDAPAVALYQPRFLYVVRKPLYGFDQKISNTASDRYSNIENWMIREEKQ